jgi:acylaminoacyl-peptidase
MNRLDLRVLGAAALVLLAAAPAFGGEPLRLKDVFQIEYASDPQVSPDGKQVVYVRNFMDVMKDKPRSHLWFVNVDGSDHRPVTSGDANESSPRWSPDGKRLLYVSDGGGSGQLHCRWMDKGETAQLTRLPSAPVSPSWSPDGKSIAFTMLVEEKEEPFVELPGKPEGAEWAKPPKVMRKLTYRFDGKGYLKNGYYHLFVVPAEGGAARQLTSGPYDHMQNFFDGPTGAPSWSPDGKAIVISGNRHKDAEHEVFNTEVYEVTLADGAIKALTDRKGPDEWAVLSPDGKRIAYSGFEDKGLPYQMLRLTVMNRDGTGKRVLNEKLDREAQNPVWNKDGSGLYFQYTDRGNNKIGFIDLDGKVKELAENVGGTEIGRPYASGSFSVGGDGVLAFTLTDPSHPADVAVRTPKDAKPRRLTALNDGWLRDKELGPVEEFWFGSSHEKRKIQGWVVKPPRFDPKKKYPLILEIHGGPQAEYGPYFSAEIQLYAAAGYVVLYTNPRGSTGYGEAFTQLINGAYPGHDYDDLMSGVDEVLKRGYVDADNLFVTGGSGGGILTAWIVGKTKRFRAAVAAKAIVNWYSSALTSDSTPADIGHWFTRAPWEDPEQYLKLSPISLVGNVTTPTMLLTGEEDYRCPISEAEQFYAALKLRKVDTALVRIPEASHYIVDRPSRLMAKVACILKWFDTHQQPAGKGAEGKSNPTR